MYGPEESLQKVCSVNKNKIWKQNKKYWTAKEFDFQKERKLLITQSCKQ